MLNIRALLLCLSSAMACSGEGCGPRRAPKTKASAAAPSTLFLGMCDASAAVALSPTTFVVANDEDNVLRLYDAVKGGAPLYSVDLSSALALHMAGGDEKHAREADLEAAAILDGVAYWIGSHGRSASGKRRPERQTFLATSAPTGGGDLVLVGRPYHGLLRDMLAERRHAALGLEAASRLAPKEPGGLNVEAMAVRAEGGLWIGFRGPIPSNKALLVALENPRQLLEGVSASFGEPVLLDLGGLGVRALLHRRAGGYLIIAGASGAGGPFRLFSWSATRELRELRGADFNGFSPEALLSLGHQGKLLALSDDGTRSLHGRECKQLKDASQKQFRGLWLTPRSDW